MLAKLFYGRQPVLLRRSRFSAPIRELIDHMRETLADAQGVGLAAPQVSESLQLAIIEDKADYQASLTREELAERERKPLPSYADQAKD